MVRLRRVRYTYSDMCLLLPRLLVLLVLAFGLAACGSDGDDAAAPETATGDGETVTAPETGAGGAAGPDFCSATDIGLELPEQELPPPVAEVRERVFTAATECDYEELERIALEQGEGFTFTFGDQSGSPSEYWRNQEQEAIGEPMYALVTILTLPVTRNESGSYAWPSAYNENPTDADWQALVDAFLYAQVEVDDMREQGTGYIGWRTAITPEGDWQFFVAGD
jgi:hypothetical protein